MDLSPPQCRKCGKHGVLPSVEENAPFDELCCVLCGTYFTGTSAEVAQAYGAVRRPLDRPVRPLDRVGHA